MGKLKEYLIKLIFLSGFSKTEKKENTWGDFWENENHLLKLDRRLSYCLFVLKYALMLIIHPHNIFYCAFPMCLIYFPTRAFHAFPSCLWLFICNVIQQSQWQAEINHLVEYFFFSITLFLMGISQRLQRMGKTESDVRKWKATPRIFLRCGG